jgi:hypothetical protein
LRDGLFLPIIGGFGTIAAKPPWRGMRFLQAAVKCRDRMTAFVKTGIDNQLVESINSRLLQPVSFAHHQNFILPCRPYVYFSARI